MSENFKPGVGGGGGGELSNETAAAAVEAAVAEDISLYRSTDSLDSLSSGDSDGGPAEPTLAEISLLSASIDARNVEAAKDEVDATSEANETVEVTPVFPAGKLAFKISRLAMAAKFEVFFCRIPSITIGNASSSASRPRSQCKRGWQRPQFPWRTTAN